MAEYSKKLHIRKQVTETKDGKEVTKYVVTDITLYDDEKDVEAGKYIMLRDGNTKLYAALVPVGDSLATPLRIRKEEVTYAVGEISPLYAVIGITMTSKDRGFAKWEVVNKDGNSWRESLDGKATEVIGMVMTSPDRGFAKWEVIDGKGDNWYKSLDGEATEVIGMVMTSPNSGTAKWAVIDGSGKALQYVPLISA